MPNRLAGETSPYLLQHKDNPVDWYPWGDEALCKARTEDKPIFLSVGYSACHWCHVMAHESFEDEATAQLLNDNYVAVKVDREERPDLDAVYMDAVQAISGHGGWPMSVFLTPDGVPFYGGTYYPPTPRPNMPSFRQILSAVADVWREEREDVLAQGSELLATIRRAGGRGGTLQSRDVPGGVLDTVVATLEGSWDDEHGGLRGAPKFPQPMLLELLLRIWARSDAGDPRPLQMVERTLRQMAAGGIYDQLGGGFARYSVDAHWGVPHFEKMLYDNTQLVPVYLHAWQITGNDDYRRVATETLDYLEREMLQPEGGLSSSQDADSEGEEGRFFVWTPDQIRTALGDDLGAKAAAAFAVTEQGNFEHGTTVLSMADSGAFEPAEPAEVRRRLFDARSQRVAPATDDKVLTSWNGLAIAAFAEAARLLDRPDYRDVALGAAEHILTRMSSGGRLLHTWREGRAAIPGFCDDYGAVAVGLLELYGATRDERYWLEAKYLTDTMLEHFADPEGGFFSTADDAEALVVRPKEIMDNAVPSPNALAADACARLFLYTGEDRYADAARRAIGVAGAALERHPHAFGRTLGVLAFLDSDPVEIAVVGPVPTTLLEVLDGKYLPFHVLAATDDPLGTPIPLLRDRTPLGNSPTAYVCRRFTCLQPTTDPDVFLASLQSP